MENKIYKLLLVSLLGIGLVACDNDSKVVSQNLSTDADNFKVLRKIVLYNSITDNYILEIEGFCSFKAFAEHRQLEMVCKVGDGKYQKHVYGYSDNTPYTIEQLDATNASPYHYKRVFKPQSILPLQNVEVR